jgi:hypothetical protein
MQAGSRRVTDAQLVPVAASTDGASDPAEHQQHDTYDEKYPADGGNDGWYRQQIADKNENDAENDQRILLGRPEETYMVVKMRYAQSPTAPNNVRPAIVVDGGP